MKKILLKTMLLLCALVVGSSAWGQSSTTLFYESFGSTTSNTAFASYTGYSATTDMFTTSGAVQSHYSGSGKVGRSDISAANLSSGYTGASGLSGCYHAGTANTEATIIQISNIDIDGYESLSLSFGALGGSTSHKVNVSYKIDNGSETSLISNGAITNASWTFKSANITGTGSSLTLIFKHKPTNNWTIRMDDIKVTGVLASTDPSSDAAFTNTTPSINFPATKTYTQTATTASGYTGTVTYAITANTAGATIDSSTGAVTVTKDGSVTVKATAPAVTGFTKSEATYTLTVNDTRTETPGLAWSAATAEVTYGATDNVFPTLTNTHNVPVTYSSTNEAAATIDPNTGVITLNDVTATTSIKAVFAGNDDYLDQTVSYTLNVKKGPFAVKDGVFDFVGAASADPFEDYGSGMILSSSYTTTNKTWTAGNVTMVTSRVSGNGYRWWEDDGTLRFYNESKATFSVPSGYVITKIETTGANFSSANPSGLSGGTWSGASNEVALTATGTRSIKTITVTYTTASQNGTITPAGWASYTCAYPLDLSTLTDGFTAYYASEVEGGKVTLTSTTAKVSAGEGLMIKGAAGETFSVNVAASGSAISGNLLKGQLTTSEVAASAGGTYHYVFGYKTSDATEYGFYNLTSATSVPAGKAYLETTASLAAARLDMVFDEATAIEEVENTQLANGKWYDLQGRLVAQPTKGLYIVNGKKVFIK